MLGIGARGAVSAANSDAGVDLEAGCAIRIDQLDRCGPLPGPSVVACMGVNAGAGAEHIVFIDANVDGGNSEQIVLDFILPGADVDDPGLHAVVEGLAIDAAAGPLRSADIGSGGGLLDHVIEEDVALGIDTGGGEAGFEGGSSQRGGFVDGDGSAVERAGGAGSGSVGGVANFRAGGVGGDDQLERRGVKAAIDAEVGVADHAVDVGGVVKGAGGGRGHVAVAGEGNRVQGSQCGKNQEIRIVG